MDKRYDRFQEPDEPVASQVLGDPDDLRDADIADEMIEDYEQVEEV